MKDNKMEESIQLFKEGSESVINLEKENTIISGGAVSSVNGMTGDVVLTTSDLENTSNYQNATEVNTTITSAISTESSARQQADNGLQIQINSLVEDLDNKVDTTELSNYYDKTTTDTLLNGKQNSLTAGSNIEINNNIISATDTTYSDFTGTDGSIVGESGLVPAPGIADNNKFLKSNGSWETIPSINVVQTTGTSTTEVMSQNAITLLIGNIESALHLINNGGTL